MRVNQQIRVPKVRVISADGEQVGILSTREAMSLASEKGLDLVEIVPTANPPVCKIIDYGKYRYDQTKKDKESKKASHQVKVKEVKVKPNINEHDLEVKLRRAREFLSKGNKVKITLMFRGRERARPELGYRLLERMRDEMEDVAQVEAEPKIMGRFLTMVVAPSTKKKSKPAAAETNNATA